MQYEDIIYPAGILAMAVRLEEFLRQVLRGEVDPADGLGALIGKFANAFQNSRGTDRMVRAANGMSALNRWRKDCAHPDGRKVTANTLKKARRVCEHLDKDLGALTGESPELGRIMISCSLRYDMGNAGDIVKHGMLAEFVKWWVEGGQKLRYADPFGGRPWGVARPAAASRVKSMHEQGFALGIAQKAREQIDSGKGITTYYGSSHVVKNVAGKREIVYADDADKLAREDLRASGLHIINDAPGFPGYKPDDGYAVLDHVKSARLNMVLIDPYKEFMRDEFSGDDEASVSPKQKRFARIIEVTEKHPDLWVAVFVLDWKETSRRYQEFKNGPLADRAVGLRCARLKGKKHLEGENFYDMETVLVSKRLQGRPDKRLRALLGRLDDLERGVAKAVPGSNVSSFGLDQRLRG